MSTIKTIFKWLGVILGVPALYLLAVAIVPGIKAPAQPLPEKKKPPRDTEEQMSRLNRSVSFEAKGTALSAWLFLPEGQAIPAPCIIMGHGLGGIKEMGLEAYAHRFQHAGYAVLVFDYRYFGESAGEPRQLVWIPDQQEDWLAAVDYARSLPGVDPDRIGLWGTSLSGGHVIVTAASDDRIACVAAQVPVLDNTAAALHLLRTEGVRHMTGNLTAHLAELATIVHAQRDLVRSWLRLSPHRIPLVGKAGSIAVIPDADAWNCFAELAPEDFVNEVCARIVIRMDKYRPIKEAAKVHCPVLIQVCEHDPVTPRSVVEDATNRLREHVEVKRYPLRHFGIYTGDGFDKAVTDQLAFFQRHL
jgi:dienelactone hydrolase